MGTCYFIITDLHGFYLGLTRKELSQKFACKGIMGNFLSPFQGCSLGVDSAQGNALCYYTLPFQGSFKLNYCLTINAFRCFHLISFEPVPIPILLFCELYRN